MDDEFLKVYIPQLGLRIAAREHVLRHKGSNDNSRKETLLQTLRTKLEAGRLKRKRALPGNLSNSVAVNDIEQKQKKPVPSAPVKEHKLVQISIGWLNWSSEKEKFVQVRMPNGGGIRISNVN
jgi:hypothetical protein